MTAQQQQMFQKIQCVVHIWEWPEEEQKGGRGGGNALLQAEFSKTKLHVTKMFSTGDKQEQIKN